MKTPSLFALPGLTLLLTAGLALAAQPTVAQLTAVLQSGASREEKATACRQLAWTGTREAVAPLAALLADPELSHMARYALETLPDPAVDAALREAAGRLQGRLLIGVIGSLGVRQDAKAAPLLVPRLQDSDPGVAEAAARALGSLATPEAVKGLQKALPKAEGAQQRAVCEGLLRAAERQAARGERRDALALYESLRALKQAPQQVRVAAFRGTVLNDPKRGLTLVREALQQEEYLLAAAAARTTHELPGAEVTRALTDELARLPVDRQVLVIQTLGKRQDPGALPALEAAARNGPVPVRTAALKALPELQQPTAVPTLLALMKDPNTELAQLAEEGLASLPGREADAAVKTLLASTDPAQRVTGIGLVARRRMTACTPDLLKAATDTDPRIRQAALKRLGELAGPADLPAMLDLLARTPTGPEMEELEQALTVVCGRSEAGVTGQLIARLPGAKPAPKAVLIRLLGVAGGPDALKAVRASLGDTEPTAQAAAVRTLADWKTPDAIPELLQQVQVAAKPADRTLCLRAYLKWAGEIDLPSEQRWTMCQSVAGLVKSEGEMKLLLAALGRIKSVESLALVAPYLENAGTRDEAGAAVVAIADEILKGSIPATTAATLVEPLQKVVNFSTNDDLSRKARARLQQAKNKAGKAQ